MNRQLLLLAALLALIFLGSPHAVRAEEEPATVKITNKICPMAKMLNGAESVNVEHRGRTITLCCEACLEPWFKLTEAQRDAKLAKATAKIEPYPFATCPVSGKPLDGMGGAVIKQYEGREVRFCCKGCVGKYEKNRAKFDARIDQMIVKDQVVRYPLTTCVVSGAKLGSQKAGSMGKPVDQVIGNRLFRLCCAACKKKLAADPAGYAAKLDAAVKKAQSANYPLKTCVVSGKPLGSQKPGNMGKAPEIVAAGRLVRFCCKGCIAKFNKAPAGYIAKLDAAAKKK